jgi:hypothetical protein
MSGFTIRPWRDRKELLEVRDLLYPATEVSPGEATRRKRLGINIVSDRHWSHCQQSPQNLSYSLFRSLCPRCCALYTGLALLYIKNAAPRSSFCLAKKGFTLPISLSALLWLVGDEHAA